GVADVELGGGVALAGSVAAAADGEAADAPPAAFSNVLSLPRSSTSFALMVGSIAPVPLVPTAPVVPAGGVRAGSSLEPSGPRSAVMLVCTFANAPRQSAFDEINSLKLLMSCDTCVRVSPVNCEAAGSCVNWLNVSRASTSALRAAS